MGIDTQIQVRKEVQKTIQQLQKVLIFNGDKEIALSLDVVLYDLARKNHNDFITLRGRTQMLDYYIEQGLKKIRR